MNNPILEVCVASILSALAAQEGGAQRIELCDNLLEGGTTPSYGAMEMTREMLQINIHVLIRPRGGDFLYSPEELETMKRDIKACKKLGIDGVVIGFLNADGTIDTRNTREMVELAQPMSVTFHRAYDMCLDPWEALKALKTTGVDRLLTSGQKNSALDAADLIKELIKYSDDAPLIMPGAGLDDKTIETFAQWVNAKEYHATLRSRVQSDMIYRKEKVYMGGFDQIPEFELKITDAEKVRRFIEVLRMNKI